MTRRTSDATRDRGSATRDLAPTASERRAAAGDPEIVPTAPAPQSPPPTPVTLQVAWGDLTLVPADVHAVGHYQGVMPVSAEGALDAAISGTDPSRRIIAEHTRRQWFLGAFGHVNYFPSAHDVVKLAAVMGMGRPGTFTEARGKRLAENMLTELCALGSAQRVATVGIGSGAGTLSIDQSARALAEGFFAALRSTQMRHPCTEIVVVEYDRLRAERFLAAFRDAVDDLEPGWLAVAPAVATGANGGLSLASASIYALEVMAKRVASGEANEWLEKTLDGEGRPGLASLVAGRLTEADTAALVQSAELHLRRGVGDTDRPPIRISVLDHDGGRSMRIAAITGTATVPERQIDTDPRLVDEIIRRMNDPEPHDLAWLAELMSRIVLPADLQALVTSDSPLVFEVDRRTAQIHWELVVDLLRQSAVGREGRDKALVLQTSVSRQLRTTYSRVPALEVQQPDALRVLLIGDPGGEGFSLPEARKEAEAVRAKLGELGIFVTALIGAPGRRSGPTIDVRDGAGRAPAARPATRLDVLRELLSGHYQIVHFCGHGTFDPDDPRRAGWVFADGLLTSRELAQLGTPPRLVVANACFTARLGGAQAEVAEAARTGAGTGAVPGPATTGAGPVLGGGGGLPPTVGRPIGADEARLTPSLAEEFFRTGVAHYVGAAWPVADDDARLFATTLYERLLGPARADLGEAMTAARSEVWDSHAGAPEERGTTWAAYQHYGDPTDHILAVDEVRRDR
ncbi:MAG TPA: CHAT domain-containing protein [Acidimicrobiales bacterium]|nr:CHAT domain-containing protein [Acidimicrobiales bacterium]